MGDPRRKNDDGFEQEALSVLQGGNDTGFDDEAAGVLAPKKGSGGTAGGSFEPDPNLAPPNEPSLLEQFLNLFPKATADNPLGIDPRDAAAQQAQWDRMSQPGGVVREGVNSLVQPAVDAMMMSEGGPIAGVAKDLGGAAIKGGSDAYTRSGGDVLEALVGAKDAVTDPLTLALSGGGAALRGAGKLAAKSGNALEEAQYVNRARAAVPESALSNATKLNGPDYVPQLGKAIQDAGLHEGGFGPASSQRYFRNAESLAADAQDRMGKAEGAISAMPDQPTVDVSNTIYDQRAQAAAERRLAAPQNEGVAAYRDQLAVRLEGDTAARSGNSPAPGTQEYMDHVLSQLTNPSTSPGAGPTGMLPWSRAVEQRRNMDNWINWGAAPGVESAQNGVLKNVAGDIRAATDQALNDPRVPADVAQEWRGGRDDYALASSVRDPALAGIWKQNGTQQMSPGSWAARGVGGAIGAMGGWPGAMIGQELGGAAVSNGRGYSALAGVQGSAANLLNLGAQGAEGLGSVAQRGAAISATEQLQQVQSQSRGQMQPQIVESLLDSNPQALGPYAQPLMQARKDGTLNQKLTQLRNTDDVWQRQYMPQLQQMSAQAQ